MKDYEKLYQACLILKYYSSKDSNYNLHPDHDIIYLCFGVSPENVAESDKKKLEELDVFFDEDSGEYAINISC